MAPPLAPSALLIRPRLVNLAATVAVYFCFVSFDGLINECWQPSFFAAKRTAWTAPEASNEICFFCCKNNINNILSAVRKLSTRTVRTSFVAKTNGVKFVRFPSVIFIESTLSFSLI